MNEQPPEHETICDEQILKVRLEAVSQAQKRSRGAFLASTIVALAITITMWNAYFSWYRSFLFMKGLAESSVTQQAQRTFIDEWVRSLKISIPILGIHVGIGDAVVLGSASLYIICIWLYFCMRRENHTVGTLLRDTKNCGYAIRNMVFHGVVSFAIFTTATEFDDPITSLEGDQKKSKTPTGRIVRGTYKALLYLPAITIAAIIVMDIVSITLLLAPLREPNNQPLARILPADDWIRRILMEIVGGCLFGLTLTLCIRNNNYNDSTEKLLKDFEDKYLKLNEI